MAYRWAGGTFPRFTWPAGYSRESGFCYLGQISESFIAAIKDKNEPIVLCEDGIPLGSPNSPHDEIRTLGLGRYSVWKGWLYFASSDNADPIGTGRCYELVCGKHRTRLGSLELKSLSGHNLIRAHDEFERGADVVTAEPSMVSLISTADCNIDCPGCSQNVVRLTRVQHRPETVPAVLSKVPYLTQLIWHGGEPFLIKRFRDFVDGFDPASNPNLTFGFTSNGTMITEEEARKLAKFPRINASVSFDSFNPETFARIRAGASFDRVWTNFERLLRQHDAPAFVCSVGMIVCKSNFAELADNLTFAITHDIGLNLSPVLLYPVTEQLNVFENFDEETIGWEAALTSARAIASVAKLMQKSAASRVDTEGMVGELSRIYEAAKADRADQLEVECEIIDRYGSLARMRRPVLIVSTGASARAYVRLRREGGPHLLRIPRRYLDRENTVRIEVVHDVMEPEGCLISQTGSLREDNFALRIHVPEFAGSPRPRNVKWANYGDATPDGLHVVDPKQIHAAYHALYASELENRGARLEFVRRPHTALEYRIPRVSAGQVWRHFLSRIRRAAGR